MSTPSTPRLHAVTRPLTSGVDLLPLTDPAAPLVWLRGDRGAIGAGEALRLTFRGPSRFRDAAAAWQRVVADATIDDPVGVPGSGLVAFGAFSFADGSETESTLIVPRTLVAQHRDIWWVTTVHDTADTPTAATTHDPDQPAADPHAPELPAAIAPGPWPGVQFADLHSQTAASVRDYLAGVAEADARIARGELEKIVIARQVRGELTAGADLRAPIARLAERYLDCWTFAVDGLIGASPETLVRSTGGSVSARVLAGTRGRHTEDAARDARARDELLTSSKEQHEHAFAVQSVVTALAPHVTGLRTNEEPFALELPNVWHLATDLGATLGEAGSSLALVDALHPTAAVAGTPTRDAIDAIDELEPFDRGRYSGAVGWIDHAGDGEWAIALRCAQLSGPDAVTGSRRVLASAGGGIVAGSDPAGELRETVSKFRPVTEAFAR
ncbi:isochorismate synthase [Leucobacter sp. HY1910]